MPEDSTSGNETRIDATDAPTTVDPFDPSTLLRVGTSTGETVFAHHRGEAPASKVGQLVGMIKIPELAHQVCAAYNAMQDASAADLPARVAETVSATLESHFATGGDACACGAAVTIWDDHVATVLGDAILPVVAGALAEKKSREELRHVLHTDLAALRDEAADAADEER